ncbi:MAG: hypothetical protein FJ100_13985 [Deltaproteobacteria bacterium]|nr:hypothetical protein [Deltaproteobacteria bacterium]
MAPSSLHLRRPLAVPVALALWLAGCVHDNVPSWASDSGALDGAVHASADAPPDAGTDVAADGGGATDAAVDSGADADAKTAGDSGGASDVADAGDGIDAEDAFVNLPPSVTWTLPADATVVQIDSEVTFVAQVSDDVQAPTELGLALSVDGKLDAGSVPLKVSAKGTITFTLLMQNPGKHSYTLSATDYDNATASATVTVLVNIAAGAPVVTITPAWPKTTDDLQAVIVQPAVDAESGSMPLAAHSYQWYRYAKPVEDLQGPTVPADRTAAGETWRVEVWANDGSAAGLPATASVTIDNSAPGPVTLALAPTEITVASTVTCAWGAPASTPTAIRSATRCAGP